MLLAKVALKILVVSMIMSLMIAGCGGSEEVPAEPLGGAPSGGASESAAAGSPASPGQPGQPAPNGAGQAGQPAAEQTLPPGSSQLPPGDVPKDQEPPEKR
jgi:hypothetical protein